MPRIGGGWFGGMGSSAGGAGTTFEPGAGFQIGHTWLVTGPIAVPSGDLAFIPPFYVPVKSSQSTKLVRARYKINSGTSVTAKLQKNGVDISGYTGISVTTTTAETDAADVALADNDVIALVVTAVSGSPYNLSFTVVLEHEPV